ncbi:MAG: integrase core domain-containing protein, partial [Candidatus Omnitrophota bacterium]
HIDDTRDTLPATIAMNEAVRTTTDNQCPTLITDGNPSYPSGIHFLNESRDNNKILHKKVIGLQNLDSESTEFRPFKQLIERLNRTYKFHTQAANGFNSTSGAIALTTLFVTYYNFFRPHSSLNYEPPIPLDSLQSIPTLQGKWANILNSAFSLN